MPSDTLRDSFELLLFRLIPTQMTIVSLLISIPSKILTMAKRADQVCWSETSANYSAHSLDEFVRRKTVYRAFIKHDPCRDQSLLHWKVRGREQRRLNCKKVLQVPSTPEGALFPVSWGHIVTASYR